MTYLKLYKRFNGLILIVTIAIVINLLLNIITLASVYRAFRCIDNKISIEEQKQLINAPKGIIDVCTDLEPETIETDIEIVEEPKEIDLGQFKITAYCPCKKCCGKWSYEVTGKQNKTSSGTIPKAQHTIAADTDILPYGSRVKINNIIYVVEDTGSKVKGNHIDIYYDDHNEALNSGLGGYHNVYLIK